MQVNDEYSLPLQIAETLTITKDIDLLVTAYPISKTAISNSKYNLQLSLNF